MKKDIHPEYKEVIFNDATAGFAFLTRSTISSEKTMKWEDGKEYPVVQIEVSSASHPFYTGKQMIVDTARRVDRFNKRREQQEEASKVRKGKRAKEEARKAKKDETSSEA